MEKYIVSDPYFIKTENVWNVKTKNTQIYILIFRKIYDMINSR